jgi:hypothetical protein
MLLVAGYTGLFSVHKHLLIQVAGKKTLLLNVKVKSQLTLQNWDSCNYLSIINVLATL